MERFDYFRDLEILNAADSIVHRPRVRVFHNDCYSLEYIRSGNVRLVVDGVSYLLEAPAVFWLRPGPAYQFIQPHPGEPYEHIWLDLSGPRIERMIRALEQAFPRPFVRLRHAAEVTRIFLEVSSDFQKSPQIWRGKIAAGLEELMWQLEMAHTPPRKGSTDRHGILRLARMIREAPFDGHDPAAFARSAGLSEEYFRRLFRRKLGIPVCRYIQQQRIARAGELLLEGEYRIKEIANMAGFDDLSEFSRAFKLYFGMSPRAYRDREQTLPAQ